MIWVWHRGVSIYARCVVSPSVGGSDWFATKSISADQLNQINDVRLDWWQLMWLGLPPSPNSIGSQHTSQGNYKTRRIAINNLFMVRQSMDRDSVDDRASQNSGGNNQPHLPDDIYNPPMQFSHLSDTDKQILVSEALYQAIKWLLKD